MVWKINNKISDAVKVSGNSNPWSQERKLNLLIINTEEESTENPRKRNTKRTSFLSFFYFLYVFCLQLPRHIIIYIVGERMVVTGLAGERYGLSCGREKWSKNVLLRVKEGILEQPVIGGKLQLCEFDWLVRVTWFNSSYKYI